MSLYKLNDNRSTTTNNNNNKIKSTNESSPSNVDKITQQHIYDIEWYMLDKTKYFPYTILSSICVRTLLYPLTLVRTRLQVQIQNTVYKGTFDAIKTIYKLEGFTALYRSFLVYNLQLIPNVTYITSFERIRHHVCEYTTNTYLRAMIAGGVSSLLSQSMVVPIDVVTQHLMLVGQKASLNAQKVVNLKAELQTIDRIKIPLNARKSNLTMLNEVCRQIYAHNGFSGFYRGYLLSTVLMSTNSALWWPFYYFYQDRLKNFFPPDIHPILLQSFCAPLSSISSNIITNPLDVIRARTQILKTKQSLSTIVKVLWQQEGVNLLFKGLTARLTHSTLYSYFIMLGYETVKRNSLKEEYKK